MNNRATARDGASGLPSSCKPVVYQFSTDT